MSSSQFFKRDIGADLYAHLNKECKNNHARKSAIKKVLKEDGGILTINLTLNHANKLLEPYYTELDQLNQKKKTAHYDLIYTNSQKMVDGRRIILYQHGIGGEAEVLDSKITALHHRYEKMIGIAKTLADAKREFDEKLQKNLDKDSKAQAAVNAKSHLKKIIEQTRDQPSLRK